MTDDFIPGDHNVIDDRTGLKVKASKTQKEWTGAVVSRDVFETRHPQDLIRARRDNATVADPRPRPVDRFIGPLSTKLTAAAAAGDQTIEVDSSVRMEGGDRLSIMLDNGDTFRAIISSLPDVTHITLTEKMPSAAGVGKVVYDNTAMSPATLP